MLCTGVEHVLYLCYNRVIYVLHVCYTGVEHVLYLCYNHVIFVVRVCYTGVETRYVIGLYIFRF